MKQILQSLKTGCTEIADVPVPHVGQGELLIGTSHTLVSAGTERMLVEFGRANLLNKARQQPQKVGMVLEKARTDGLAATLGAVRSKLDQPLALGYCNVGVVLEIGAGVEGFALGDRVVSNGKHAEVVAVPRNLCAHIPEGVTGEKAAFTVIGAIGLQGIRLANPTLGECVVVTGLGLIGLMTVQMLRAQGCRVMGIDVEAGRLDLARQMGAEVVASPSAGGDVFAVAQAFSRGRGVDAVLITASTGSSEPVRHAAKLCRKRGRIVLVGVTGLELSRADFYEKELSFQVSCSYGPGRYDPAYEEGGHDYPVGFVRWTQQRNFEAVLDLMASGALDVAPLISHRFPLERAVEAYDLLASGGPSLGIMLEYPGVSGEPERLVRLPEATSSRTAVPSRRRSGENKCVVGFLGAGNYAGRVLIPAFSSAGAELHTVVSSGGVSAVHFGKKFGFGRAATDAALMFDDPDVNTVAIATRHDTHAAHVIAALGARKHVFCEKPLCLTLTELEQIKVAVDRSGGELCLMVGFNRRFAPQIEKMKALLQTTAEPKIFVMTVNAGEISAEHWTQNIVVGGGRIIGEACHFIDLLRYLVGRPIVQHHAVALGRHSELAVTGDKATITLEFADGSVGTIHYLANGHKAFPKERLEVFCAGRVLQLDNFRSLRGWGWSGFSKFNLWRQDKGQNACAAAFVEAVRLGNPSPISIGEVLEVSRVSIELGEELR
ncbi:MAG: bi-domain-containing oxidoreductase [Gammaproteobacteria bacterium]|nr:bi-domain-containing oxidoreductase [Gammaproteobacteria bacterium]